MSKAPAIQRSASEHWNTPPSIVERVKLFGGGRIALDPCSNGFSQVGADVEFTKEQDGLWGNWYDPVPDGGLVFVNPPYDMETISFVAKKARNLSSYLDRDSILLVPCKTDQEWFQDTVLKCARAICFIKGRVKFWSNGAPVKGGATFACCLIWFGPATRGFDSFFDAFSVLGTCIKLR